MGIDLRQVAEWAKDGQDPKEVARITEKVSSILVTGEHIQYVAVQDKVLSMDIRRDAAVLTNRRFILFKQGLLGGASFSDHIWRDLQDAQLREGMLRSTLLFRTVKGTVLAIDDVPKKQARLVYAFAQEREMEVLEERRTREMEEKRAAAGGVHLHTNQPPAQASPATQ